MATFPTTKTVPLDKDIGVVSALSSFLNTAAREQLSVVLANIDTQLLFLNTDYNTKISAETSRARAAETTLQNNINIEATSRQVAVANEQSRAQAAEALEITTRSTVDSWINNAIESDRTPLRVLFSSNAIYTVNSATATRSLGSTGANQNSLGVTSGVYQSDFSGCSVNFSNGTLTYNAGPLGTPAAGTFTLPTITGQANKWIKASLVLLPTSPDTIIVTFASSFASTAAAVPSPVVTGGVPIGIVSLQVNSNASGFSAGSQSNVIQFAGAGSGGSGGSGSGSPIDPNFDESFIYYTRSDLGVDKKKFIASTNGTDQILGLGKLTLNSGQYVTSTDLTGSMLQSDAAIINYAQVRLLYNTNKVDTIPTVGLSIDGGNSWNYNAQNTISQGNQFVADFAYPDSGAPLVTSGTGNGSNLTSSKVAMIFAPTYRTVLSSFQASIKTTASSLGTIVGKIYAVTSGTPTALLAVSKETYTIGSDIGTTSSYKSFSFSNFIVSAGASYALSVEAVSGGVVIWDQTTTTSAVWPSSSYGTSGWSASSSKLSCSVYGYGQDVRLTVTSGTDGSELVGFGVDMVLNNQVGLTGNNSWEMRQITSTEASTGFITLNSITYAPGSHQLHANLSGHDFIAPDFVEVGPNTVRFPSNFLQAGDIVRFYTSYGLVDSSAVSLQKINTLNEAVVGSAAQVSSGVALYASIQQAINSVPAGGKVTILQGTYNENIIVNKEVFIEGKGRSSIINGTISFNAAATGAMLKFTKVLNNVTIDIAAQGVNVTDNWIALGYSVTGGTNCLILNIGENQ